jgi:hypothetical protein
MCYQAILTVDIIKCTYTNLDGIAYTTAKL